MTSKKKRNPLYEERGGKDVMRRGMDLPWKKNIDARVLTNSKEGRETRHNLGTQKKGHPHRDYRKGWSI